MRRLLAVSATVLLLLLGGASAREVSDPSFTSLLLADFATPQLAPGESGPLDFNVTNPYPWSLNQTVLSVEIYAYRSLEEDLAIGEITRPPVFAESDTPEVRVEPGAMASGTHQRLRFTVVTDPASPHGGVFSQGTYFVRFRLEFDYLGNRSAVLVSIGFFTPEERAEGLREPTAAERAGYRWVGNANYTYLGERLGLSSIDGLLPDTGFGVKEPLPLWPFTALLVGAGLAIGLALYAYHREQRAEAKGLREPRE